MCSCRSTPRGEHRIGPGSRRSRVRAPHSERSPSLSTDRWRPCGTGCGAGAFRGRMQAGQGLTPRQRHAKSCGCAGRMDGPSSAWTPAGPTGACCAPRRGSPSGAVRSSGSWSRRRAGAALHAGMTAPKRRSSCITSIRRRSRSDFPHAASATELRELATRLENASSSAATATRRWRRECVCLRLPGVDSNHQELINSQSCCRYITGDRRCRA
jgi:hypothetical protein